MAITLRGYWEAFKILPPAGKVLMVAGFAVSGFIYWTTTVATPSPNAQCLNGPCSVSTDQIASTRLLAIAFLSMMGILVGGSLTAINYVLDKKERKVEPYSWNHLVSTRDFWNQFPIPVIRKPRSLSLKLLSSLVGLWIFNGFIWTVLLRLVLPDSFWALVGANIFVTIGSLLITIGIVFWNRVD